MLHDIGTGAMNAPRCLQLNDNVFSDVEISANTPRFFLSLRGDEFLNFMPPLGINQQLTALTNFSENLRASLFTDDLWNEPTLSQIQLAASTFKQK
jgi:hypothetical protein